jgi:hypothetical protein
MMLRDDLLREEESFSGEGQEMKWELRFGNGNRTLVLSTNLPLPWMFDTRLLRGSVYSLGDLLHRTPPRWRVRYALRVARRNRGRVPFELVAPARVYHQLLIELASVEGLLEVQDIDRYSLHLVFGQLFSPIEIGLEVGMVLSSKLYPDEPFDFDAGRVERVLKGRTTLSD